MSPQPVSPVVVDRPPLMEESAPVVERVRIPFQRMILFGLNRTGKHIYEGTVPVHIKAARRATDKRARKARKLHR